ncbi:MAG: tRNA (adenosine(37)-N6)-dimethylallyltransferase MiaA [Vulcanimicrobiaceae bacterium]
MTGVLVLGGPTASGKTELAIALAETFGAEIVNADSRQIYRGMSIGTAAPTAAQRAQVPHHLVEFLDPHERYSAGRFVADAIGAIGAIATRGKRSLVVGGTGFYLRALCGDVALAPEHDPTLRGRLAREVQLHPTGVLHDWLAAREPGRAAELAPSDGYRIVRALEISLARSHSNSSLGGPVGLRAVAVATRKVVLDVEIGELERRIGARVDAMLARGFVDEADRIGVEAVAADAVGYPQALAYLDGLLSAGELRAALVRATRRYAKRQRTWFRSERDVTWIPPDHAFDAIAATARDSLGWT